MDPFKGGSTQQFRNPQMKQGTKPPAVSWELTGFGKPFCYGYLPHSVQGSFFLAKNDCRTQLRGQSPTVEGGVLPLAAQLGGELPHNLEPPSIEPAFVKKRAKTFSRLLSAPLLKV